MNTDPLTVISEARGRPQVLFLRDIETLIEERKVQWLRPCLLSGRARRLCAIPRPGQLAGNKRRKRGKMSISVARHRRVQRSTTSSLVPM